jgi:hypothetical protein
VHARDLAQAGLERLARLVLDPPVLDEEHDVVVPVLADVPAKVVRVARERERARGRECVPEPLLDVGLEHVEAHRVDRVLEPRVLPAAARSALRHTRSAQGLTRCDSRGRAGRA